MYARGHSNFLWGSTFTAWILTYYSGYQVSLLNTIGFRLYEHIYKHYFGLDVFMVIFSAPFWFAAIFGNFLSFKLCKLKGRRQTMIITNLIGLVGSLISWVYFIPVVFGLGRLIVGFSVGSSIYVCAIYVKEISSSDMTQRLMAIHQCGIIAGSSTIVFGYFLQDLEPQGIIMYFVIAFPVIPLIIQLVLLHYKYKHDTPIYYLTTNQSKKAVEVLANIYEGSFLDQIEGYTHNDELNNRPLVNNAQENAIRTMSSYDRDSHDLTRSFEGNFKFPSNILTQSVIMMGLAPLTGLYLILMFFSGIQLYATNPLQIYQSTLAMNIVSLSSVILAVWAINYLPRVLTLQLGSIGVFTSNVIIGISIIVDLKWVSIVFWWVFLVFYQFSLGSIKWVYITEIANEYVTCMSFSAYWLSITILAIVFPFVPLDYLYIVLFLEAAATLPVLIASWKMIETKGQNPEEIEEQMLVANANESQYSVTNSRSIEPW